MIQITKSQMLELHKLKNEINKDKFLGWLFGYIYYNMRQTATHQDVMKLLRELK